MCKPSTHWSKGMLLGWGSRTGSGIIRATYKLVWLGRGICLCLFFKMTTNLSELCCGGKCADSLQSNTVWTIFSISVSLLPIRSSLHKLLAEMLRLHTICSPMPAGWPAPSSAEVFSICKVGFDLSTAEVLYRNHQYILLHKKRLSCSGVPSEIPDAWGACNIKNTVAWWVQMTATSCLMMGTVLFGLSY